MPERVQTNAATDIVRAHPTPMAFYRRQSETYLPTPHCIGPWDPGAQHGGPPAALLAGAAERYGEDAASFVVVRVTVDLLRPVGFVPLSVEVTPIRLGRRAQWLQADLIGNGQRLARATVVRVARAELSLPERTRAEPPPDGPEGKPDFVFPFFRTDEGYHRAVELRIAEGPWGQGPCTAWMRPRYPLVEGQPTALGSFRAACSINAARSGDACSPWSCSLADRGVQVVYRSRCPSSTKNNPRFGFSRASSSEACLPTSRTTSCGTPTRRSCI